MHFFSHDVKNHLGRDYVFESSSLYPVRIRQCILPIIADCGSESYASAEYIDHF